MQAFKGVSLRTRLYLLVLAAFIPVGVLIFFTAEEQKQIEKETIFHGATILARAAAIEERQQLDTARNILAAVSDHYLSSGERGDQIQSFITNLRSHFQGFADLGIVAADGRLLARAQDAAATPDYSRKAWFSECLRQKRLTMGGYRRDRIDGEPILYIAMPVLVTGQTVAAVAFAALDLNWMNRATFTLLAELPVEARLTLIDRAGAMLRYDAEAKQWSTPDGIGQGLLDRINGQSMGIVSAEDSHGVRRLYAFTPLDSSIRDRHVHLVLEIPEQTALAAPRQVFMRNMAVLVLFALLAVSAIWWAGDLFILRRVRTLVHASRGIAGGDLTTRVGDIGGRDELSHLARVFDEMADALQSRQIREHNAVRALEQSREQLRRLGVYQQQVREQERVRIARELHDDFGQSLTILKMDLAWIKKRLPPDQTAAGEKINAMFQVIDASLENLHTVMAELRPVILDDFGLAAAIEWQAGEFRNRTGIACRLEIDEVSPSLARELQTAVFRSFQELLTNIVRHAGAKTVSIALQTRQGLLHLAVTDDGRGITQAEIDAPGSYGLMGIRERLYPFNGTVTFEGHPGKGTRVVVELPLSR